MTIKQHGGIFGRNPTFNDLTIQGSITGLSDLSISGDLIFASGQGIDFSATSDGSGTSTSELFSDYEEGTWSPTVSAGWTSVTYSNQQGNYIKIGDIVTAWFYVRFSGTSAASTVSLGGLPYTPSGTNPNKFGTINFLNAPMGGGSKTITPYVASTTTFNFYEVPGSSTPVQSTGNATSDYIVGGVSYSV